MLIIEDFLALTCGSCKYMIEFQHNTQKEFSNECPYRDSIESIACMKHTTIQEYKKATQ